MEEPIIREMTEADIRQALEIERSSFSTPWSETSFFNELYNPRSDAKVAVIGETVIGYVIVRQVVDEGHILDLAVHPDFRRKGIAKTLIENIIEDLREAGCRFVYLEVRVSNNAAIGLYESFGFKIAGVRKEYYTEPKEDAVLMSLSLRLKTERLDSNTLSP